MTISRLIIVAGHAIYTGENYEHPERDENWCLQSFQKGEPPFYLEHIRAGVELAAANERALLIFSGGQTRPEAGPRSEAQSYWLLSDHFHWWGCDKVSVRAITEEYARDSYENLRFSFCRFVEYTGEPPQQITIVSWAFKERRFRLHAEAIGWPLSQFDYAGVNNPPDLAGAEQGEQKAMAAFLADPHGHDAPLAEKREQRNPFRRRHPYPEQNDFLLTL